MALPELIAVPSSKRRRWGCVIWPVVVFATALAALAYCVRPDCFVRTRSELLSPDGKHVAIQLGTTCSTGFANTSNGESVLLDRRNGWLPESEVFVTFETPPSVRWLDPNTVEITVNAVNAINVSRNVAKDVKVVYRIRDGLTEAVIRNQLVEEQRRMTEYFKNADTAETLNSNEQQRFEAFIQWAKEHARLEP